MLFLPRLLKKAIKSGTLNLVTPDQQRMTFGTPDGTEPVTIKVHDKSLDWKIAFNPELKTAEAYMDGALTLEDGEIYDLLTLFYRNRRHFDRSANMIFWQGIARSLRRFHQHNPISKSRANVKHHYDLKDELFELFLDDDRQYSCAYFPNGDETLEEAQRAKKSHIIRKLNLKPGQRILDIGCGWGGMALQIAETEDVTVKGITLSENQARVARQRAEEAGVADRVSFEICDYRELDEKFDRIVSVGMLEHVGAPHLKEYFLSLRNMLGSDGVALVHSISSKSPPGVTGPFIRKYIFPNGSSPAISKWDRMFSIRIAVAPCPLGGCSTRSIPA